MAREAMGTTVQLKLQVPLFRTYLDEE